MNKKYLKYEQQKCSLYYSFRVFYIIITDVKSIFYIAAARGGAQLPTILYTLMMFNNT